MAQRKGRAMTTPASRTTAIGVLCGAGAAVLWAAGFVAARHGIDIGMTASDITFHRCFWAGVVLLPLAFRDGLKDLNGIGWGRGLVLTFLGGPGIAFVSYSGFHLVPLGHGGVIQPSSAALFGLLLATVVLLERLPVRRAVGAAVIVAGLCVIGAEAIATIGPQGLLGDGMFALAGLIFAGFGTLLRRWRVPPLRATVAVSFLSMVVLPIYGIAFGFDRLIGFGLWENLLQAVFQGLLAGPAAIYLFTRAIVLLGAGRAAVFPALVPPSVLLIGWLVLGIVPTGMQILGLVIVLIGFRLTQRN
ncbi:MAG: DMT family transporter [Xanthobacteraceae bacterium]|nr:DMT family transporter [Xanthobacteraceae bacterium]